MKVEERKKKKKERNIEGNGNDERNTLDLPRRQIQTVRTNDEIQTIWNKNIRCGTPGGRLFR
jgi:hypothetical protein